MIKLISPELLKILIDDGFNYDSLEVSLRPDEFYGYVCIVLEFSVDSKKSDSETSKLLQKERLSNAAKIVTSYIHH